MEIIPVIDLMGGVVVSARAGDRQHYKPLESTICRNNDLFDVVADLLAFYPFKTIYLADLDAIQFSADNRELYRTLKQHFPLVEFWIDAGIRYFEHWQRLAEMGVAQLIVGSETLADKRLWPLPQQAILSLDFLAGLPLGNTDCITAVADWPERVILLNLTRVGSRQGPDMELLAAMQQKNPQRQFIYGGGVRDSADLEVLARRSVSAVLIASALHTGRLKKNNLDRYSN